MSAAKTCPSCNSSIPDGIFACPECAFVPIPPTQVAQAATNQDALSIPRGRQGQDVAIEYRHAKFISDPYYLSVHIKRLIMWLNSSIDNDALEIGETTALEYFAAIEVLSDAVQSIILTPAFASLKEASHSVTVEPVSALVMAIDSIYGKCIWRAFKAIRQRPGWVYSKDSAIKYVPGLVYDEYWVRYFNRDVPHAKRREQMNVILRHSAIHQPASYKAVWDVTWTAPLGLNFFDPSSLRKEAVRMGIQEAKRVMVRGEVFARVTGYTVENTEEAVRSKDICGEIHAGEVFIDVEMLPDSIRRMFEQDGEIRQEFRTAKGLEW